MREECTSHNASYPGLIAPLHTRLKTLILMPLLLLAPVLREAPGVSHVGTQSDAINGCTDFKLINK